MSYTQDRLLATILAAVTLTALLALTLLAAFNRPAPEVLGHVVTGGLSALAALARNLKGSDHNA